MLRIALLHSRLQLTIMAVLAGLLVWGLICVWRGRVGQGYLAGMWVIQWLLLAQGLLGVAIVVLGSAQIMALALHIIYGIVAMISIPALLRYTRTLDGREAAWYLTGGCFVLLIIVGRAFETIG
ncbi:MAG: hypothetical protein AB4911_02915 [Oscillochloridaceae bacterium umkhey_bin13]